MAAVGRRAIPFSHNVYPGIGGIRSLRFNFRPLRGTSNEEYAVSTVLRFLPFSFSFFFRLFSGAVLISRSVGSNASSSEGFFLWNFVATVGMILGRVVSGT